MLAAAVRDLHVTNPGRYVTDVRTPCPHLWENNPWMTFIVLPGEPNGDAGDRYTGLDRYGRAIYIRWLQSATGNAIHRFQYGFDRASHRNYRRNLMSVAYGEKYDYDGLYQLDELQRGFLNSAGTAITGTAKWEEDFDFDPTGNWKGYVTKVNGATTLNQSRTHNAANEITAITNPTSNVGYDPAGNIIYVVTILGIVASIRGFLRYG